MEPLSCAAKFVDPEKGVASPDEALSGARDIIAEWINENDIARAKMRALFITKGVFRSKVISGKEEEGAKYRDYFDWEEPAAKAPSHRVLAMRRGENEGFLALRIAPPEEDAISLLETLLVKGGGLATDQVRTAVRDCYKRLLSLSMETEMRLVTRKRADEEAIRVFAGNLRQLLLSPPLGQKSVLSDRSRFPYRMQGGLSGPAGKAAAQRHDLHPVRRRDCQGIRKDNRPMCTLRH